MTDTLDKVNEGIIALAKAAMVVATAAAVAVAKAASDFDKLFFASQRIGASAGNIRGFEYAIKQMGGSAESARAALEGFARFMRSSPGAESWINGLGVGTRDANGKLRDTVDIYRDLAGVMSGMDAAHASVIAQMIGTDDNTLQAIRGGGLNEYLSDYQATLKKLGLNMDEAAQNAFKFQRAMTELTTIVGLLVDKYSMKLLGFLRDASAKLAKLSAEVAATPFGAIWGQEIKGLGDDFSTLVGWISKAWDYAKKLGDVFDGSGWRRILNAFDRTDGGRSVLSSIGRDITKIMATFGSKDALAALQANGDMPAQGAGAKAGKMDVKSAAMNYFRALGWTPAQAAGIVANLNAESGMSASAVGDGGKAFGVAQWHPDRQAAFKAWSGKDIRNSQLSDQLAFVHHELTQGAEQRAGAMLRAAQNASDAGQVVSRFYERPLAADSEAARRGAAAVQLAANTTINVNGTSDPAGTAQQVANLQGRVAQDQVRNFRVALR